jgi:Ca2+-binding RTX toxin-like protein
VVYFGNDRWVEWTVPQSILQGWLDHPESNHGLMLVNELPDSFFYDLVFAAREFGQDREAQLVFKATGPLRIHVDLLDEDGLFPSAGTHEVTVLNVAPSGSVSGPHQVVPFQPIQLTLFANDPSPIDQAAGFRFEIDWQDDGVYEEIISNAVSGTVVTSSINTLGPRTIRVRVVDKDGGSSEFQHSIVVRPFYSEGELVVGGTVESDAIVIRQGTLSDTVSVIRNGTTLGTFTTQAIRIFAGPGTDSVLVEGNTHGNNMIVEANKITTDAIDVFCVDAELWSIHGQAGNDTIILRDGTGEVTGGSGNDTIISQIVAPSSWNISALNAGALRTPFNQFTFTGVENLKGNAADDTFVLSEVGRISGKLMGEGGFNTIDYGAVSTSVVINLQSNTASLTGGFAGIQAFMGSRALDTMVGPNSSNVWELQSNTRTRLNQVQLLENFEILSGGSANDEFFIDPFVIGGPSLVGGAGLDSLNYSRRKDGIIVNRQLRTATAIASFDTMESYVGGSGTDIWIGPDAVTTWTVSDTQFASIAGSTMNGFEHLQGGRLADSFLLANTQISIELSGGDGNDLITGSNADNEWFLTGEKSGSVGLGIAFNEIENLRGGTAVDRWLFSVNATGFASINGNSGMDLFDYSQWSQPVQFDVTSRSANGVEQFSSVEVLIGGSSLDCLVGPLTAATYSVNGQNSIFAANIQFYSVEEVVAGPENDTFSFASVNAGISGFIDAGQGVDTLAGFNAANDWKLIGFQRAIVNSATEVLQIENMMGGSSSDTFTVVGNAQGFGMVGGGLGRDTLDYSTFDAAVTLDLAASTGPAISNFTAIEYVVGSTFSDSILGPNTSTRWSLSGPNEGSLSTTSFSSFENLIGGTAADDFTLTSPRASLEGFADGGLGMDEVTAFNNDSTWELTGALSGNLNKSFEFRRVENLFGTSANDTFRVLPMAGSFNIVDGGYGVDTIDYSLFDQQVTVSLLTGTSTGIAQTRSVESWIGSESFDRFFGSNANILWLLTDKNTGKAGSVDFASFDELIGGTGKDTFRITTATGAATMINAGGGIDTLMAAHRSNTWSITGPGSGTLNDNTYFGHFENMTGGGLSDVFAIGNAGSIPGTLNGGAGANTLTYETWTTRVTVNQIAGQATSIANLASNFQTIIGGDGDDLLIAFSAIPSILVGNAGNDRLVGAASRDILIGGSGADILQGQTGEDILLSGWSIFDTRHEALRLLLTEWTSTRTLSERINNIRGTGTPLHHGFYLTQAVGRRTVFDDASVDQIYGGSSSDWFIASTIDELVDRLVTESWDELR